jgi:hypothetical protein
MAAPAQRENDEPVYRVQVGQVIESTCAICLQTIAYSPNPKTLAIAEKAHRYASCPALKKKARLFVISDRTAKR